MPGSSRKGDKLIIAVASDDGITIAQHFGRCGGFIVFEATPEAVSQLDYRLNSFGHHSHGHDGHDSEEAHHSHDGFIGALHDCQVVISRGMGRRALADLTAGGIKPAITRDDISARQAAELYARGHLNLSNDSSCCSH